MADENTNQATDGNGTQDMNQPVPPAGRIFSSGVSSTDGPQVNILHADHPNMAFSPLPPPTGQAPYHLSLSQVLPAAKMESINTSGRLIFHVAGDTGGVGRPEVQQIVAMQMENDCTVADAGAQPSFFYHLGDVVYYQGEASGYYPQFYEPYRQYPLPIFAIPGNHDGESTPSLAPFVTNFCALNPIITSDAGDVSRTAMTQPNVYWTLETPFVTIIGLYTNVPEGGRLDVQQIAWFSSELSAAPADKALIVAMHHPIYSADVYHAGSAYMKQLLEQAIQNTGRMPDAVFAGHVHNYQRFTHTVNGRDVPYIVAGAGGYWHLHAMAKDNGQPLPKPYPVPGMDGLTLANYCDDHHGFLRLEVTLQTIKGEYYVVPRPQDHWHDPATLLDSFTLDLNTHRLS